MKNKTHFFVGFQRTRFDQNFPVFLTIPTPAQIGGDFSQTLNADGGLIQIYDPATTRPDPSDPTLQPSAPWAILDPTHPLWNLWNPWSNDSSRRAAPSPLPQKRPVIHPTLAEPPPDPPPTGNAVQGYDLARCQSR